MKDPEKLNISVFSFGYQKSGIPENDRNNGGGFVFDCRFLPNPHHDPALRDFTGKDREIQSFFENYRAVDNFISECGRMIDKAAKAYIEKKYTDLQVCFGCTGGRHRSVFCAERFSRILSEKGYNITLKHTEI